MKHFQSFTEKKPSSKLNSGMRKLLLSMSISKMYFVHCCQRNQRYKDFWEASPAQVLAACNVPDMKKRPTKEVSDIQRFASTLGRDFTVDTFDPSDPFGD